MSLTHLTCKLFLPSLDKHHLLILFLLPLSFDATEFLWGELGHFVVLMMRIMNSRGLSLAH